MKILQLNLQQGLVLYTDNPHCVNAFCAFYNKHRGIIIIQAGFQVEEKNIVDLISKNVIGDYPNEGPIDWEVHYGSSFSIDTWDRLLDKLLSEKLYEEKLRHME